MAYDPTTGQWNDEETDVESRITRLTNTDSDYMKAAEAPALQEKHRRGLLNSSMAIQSGQAARLQAALPIASQDASQANQRYMQGRQLQSTDVTQKRDITSREALTREGYGLQRELQGSDIASRERMQGRDIEANRANLERELGSRAALQAAQAAAEKERLGMQLTAQEKLSLQELAAAERRLGLSIESEERMQTRGIGAQQQLQAAEIGSRERMQTADLASRELMQQLDNATRLQMQGLDIESQTRIANINVAAGERADVTRAAVAFEATYTDLIASITNNPDIPADARQAALDHANATRASNIAMLEQLYNIDLAWA